MAAIGTLPVLFATGVHGSRPAASAVGKGGLYSCTTHGLLYQTDGSSWTTWATLGATASGSITASGYTQSTAKMLGRSTASTGAIEEITVGSGLTLAAGTISASGGSGIPAATSFPGSPSAGDQLFRTDRGIAYYYDGTRWLSMHVDTVTFPPTNTLSSVTGTANQGRLPIPWRGVYSLYIVQFDWFLVIAAVAHSATDYYTSKLNYADTADSDTQVGSTLDSKTATTINSNYSFNQPVGVVLSTNARELKMRLDKVSSGSDLTYSTGTVSYRLIG